MNDLISRKAAIEHLKKRLYETALNNDTEHPYYEDMADNRVSVWLEEVPSAQPKIIHCKDCKWKQGSECVRFADVRPFPNDFCSRAERRTDDENYYCADAVRKEGKGNADAV